MLCQVSLKGRALGSISVLVRILYPFVLLDLSFIRAVSIYRAPAMCSRQSNDPRQERERGWHLGAADSPIHLVQKE